MKREQVIGLRVDSAELAKLQRLANYYGLTLQNVLRMLATRADDEIRRAGAAT